MSNIACPSPPRQVILLENIQSLPISILVNGVPVTIKQLSAKVELSPIEISEQSKQDVLNLSALISLPKVRTELLRTNASRRWLKLQFSYIVISEACAEKWA